MNAKISIIVPCYNQAEYLSFTLESVENQSFENWECVIVNDGSVDETESVANIWCAKDKRFKYIAQENKGLSAARNAGIRVAEGKYILPLDSDDLIHREFLEAAYNILDVDNELSIVYSNVQLFGESDEKWQDDQFELTEFMYRNLIPCTALFRKENWVEAGGYNSNMRKGFEDWDFWMSIIERGGKVYKINRLLFFYRQRANSMAKKITGDVTAELRKQIAYNHLLFYSKILGDPLTLSYKLKDVQRQKKLTESSWAYKIGSIIVKPLKILAKLFGKNKNR